MAQRRSMAPGPVHWHGPAGKETLNQPPPPALAPVAVCTGLGAGVVLGVTKYGDGVGAAAGGVAAASLWGWWRCHRGDRLGLVEALAAGGMTVASGGSWRFTEPGLPDWVVASCMGNELNTESVKPS